MENYSNFSFVTVVVPIYGVERYITRCIESILQQTYMNLQIVLVDDGSSDMSSIICDYYSNLDTRIQVIHKQNGGLSNARNTGILVSTSSWITFVDSDDYISHNFIEQLYSLANNNCCSIAQCGYARIYDEEEHYIEENIAQHKILSDIEFLENIDTSENTATWNKIYRTCLFHDIQFPDGRIHEDVATTYKLVSAAGKVAITTCKLYYYYVNQDGITKSKIKESKLALIDAYAEQLCFYASIEKYQCLIKSAATRLAAVFGTLAAHKKSTYDNQELFFRNLNMKYKETRMALLKSPLRMDFALLIRVSSTIYPLRLMQIIKQRGLSK